MQNNSKKFNSFHRKQLKRGIDINWSNKIIAKSYTRSLKQN